MKLINKYKEDINNFLVSIGSKNLDEILMIYELDNKRYYHNHIHIINMLEKYLKNIHFSKRKGKTEINYLFILAILYHDIIYDVNSSTNEEDSAKLIDDLNLSEEDKKYVKDLILFTKYNDIKYGEFIDFLILDFGILLERKINMSDLIQYEKNIRKEYLQYDLNSFVGGRYYALQKISKLLNKLNIKTYNCGINKIITYLEFIITSNTIQNSIYDI